MGFNGPELVFAKNEMTHLMLRGHYEGSNFHLAQEAALMMEERGLTGKVFIDCAHQNSKKNPLVQKELFHQFLKEWPEAVQGLMIECQSLEGNQNFSINPKPGLSITDPCLSIETVYEVLEQTRNGLCLFS